MTKSDDNKKLHAINQHDVFDEKVQYVRVDDYLDNGISLIDLVCVFVKRKALFLSVIFLVFFLGVWSALNKPVIYSYFVSLEIGHGENGEGVIEGAGTLLNKINKYYKPVESKKFLDKYSGQESLPSVTAILEKNTNIVFLESKGTIENQSINFEFINMLVDAVVLDHHKISSIYKKELEFSKTQINNSINRLKEQNQLLISQKTRLKDAESFLKKKMGLIEKSIAKSKASRRIKSSSLIEEDKVWTLLMIDNDLRADQDRLASLEEQLDIKLNKESGELESKVADNIREQAKLVSQLGRLQSKLGNFLETRALSEPLKSISSDGKSKMFVILIFLVFGVFAAVFVVIITEFISKVREQL